MAKLPPVRPVQGRPVRKRWRRKDVPTFPCSLTIQLSEKQKEKLFRLAKDDHGVSAAALIRGWIDNA